MANRTFWCSVDDFGMHVDADDKPEAKLMLLASGVITEEQSERLEVVTVKPSE